MSTEISQSPDNLQEKIEEFKSYLFEIMPGTIEHIALRDLLELEYRRLAFDKGGRPDAKYDLCTERIQRRMGVPRYTTAFDKIKGIHDDLRQSDKTAVNKLIEVGKEIGLLSQPTQRNPVRK